MGVSFNQQKKMKLFGLLVVCCVVFAHIGVQAKPNSQSVSEKLSVRDGNECSGIGEECKTNGKTCCGSLWCNGAAASHYSKTIAAHVGEDHAEAMEKHAAKVSLAKVMEYVHHKQQQRTKCL